MNNKCFKCFVIIQTIIFIVATLIIYKKIDDKLESLEIVENVR